MVTVEALQLARLHKTWEAVLAWGYRHMVGPSRAVGAASQGLLIRIYVVLNVWKETFYEDRGSL